MAQTVAPIEETKTEVIAQTSNPIEISKNNEIVISEEAGKIETKTPDSQIQDIQTNENENRDTNDKTNVDQFFKNFERKVYDNINKNVDKSALRSGQFVNIRVTFLKDGGYEQLIYVSGNMGYFNLIKSLAESVISKQRDSDKINSSTLLLFFLIYLLDSHLSYTISTITAHISTIIKIESIIVKIIFICLFS